MMSPSPPTELCSNTLIFLLLTLSPAVLPYTVEDLEIKCEPCDPSDVTKIIHPTDCTEYYYCGSNGKWINQFCPSSTYFVQEDQHCVNPAVRGGAQCAYDTGVNENIDKDITLLPQCSGATTTTTAGSSTTKRQRATTDSLVVATTTGVPKPNLTIVLAVLLAVTSVLLIAVVLGILLYRRRQNQRRPKYFYTRKSPGGSPAVHADVPPPAGNAAYLSRSLLRSERDKRVESVEYEVPMSEEPGYQEIPERSSKAYYSEPAVATRPPMALPVIAVAASPDYCNDIYSEAMSPDGEKGDDYMHPSCVKPSEDSHIYSAKGAEEPHYADCNALNEEPYDYCQPEVANPTLSFRRGVEPPPAKSPESPPYYVDPLEGMDAGNKNSYPYHTLEPLGRKD